MRWPFRRRARGRHALGAAVTAIPSTLPTVKVVPAPAEQPSAPVAVVPPLVGQPDPASSELAPGPRVELGFRDGSTAALAPDSAQAKALSSIAAMITRRDG